MQFLTLNWVLACKERKEQGFDELCITGIKKINTCFDWQQGPDRGVVRLANLHSKWIV